MWNSVGIDKYLVLSYINNLRESNRAIRDCPPWRWLCLRYENWLWSLETRGSPLLWYRLIGSRANPLPCQPALPLDSCFTMSSNIHFGEKVLNSFLTYICSWYHGWRAITVNTAGWCAYISPISLPKCGLWSPHRHHPRNLLGEAKCEILLQISCIQILANNDIYCSRARVPLEGIFSPGSLLTTGVENLKNHSRRLAFQFWLDH